MVYVGDKLQNIIIPYVHTQLIHTLPFFSFLLKYLIYYKYLTNNSKFK